MFKRIALIALCLTWPPAAAPRCRRAAAERDRGADQFKIADLKRRGSAADSTAPASETRRVVYYDVELRLDRDITLGAWDKPGAASLVTLLGAGPRSKRRQVQRQPGWRPHRRSRQRDLPQGRRRLDPGHARRFQGRRSAHAG